MKKFVMALLASVALVGAAHATTINSDVTLPTKFNISKPGFQLKAVNVSNGGAQDFSLKSIVTGWDSTTVALGSTQTFNLFVLRTLATTFEPGKPGKPHDAKPLPFAIKFDLGVLGSAVLSGVTYAVNAVGGAYGVFDVTSAPADIYIGSGKHLLISVADILQFNKGTTTGSYTPGKANGGLVKATFTVATIPVPAALPMGMGALALMGMVSRRRKSKTKAA